MSVPKPATRRARLVLGGLAGSVAALAAAPGLAGTAFADTTPIDSSPSTGTPAGAPSTSPASAAGQSGAAGQYGSGQSGLGVPQLPSLPPVQSLPAAGVLGADPAGSLAGGALSSSSLLGSDGATSASDPTPAPQGPQYGAKPETVIDGVPVEGTLNAVEGASAIVPGSGPKDYA